MTLNELFTLALKHHWSAQRYRDSGWRDDVAAFYNRHIRTTFGDKPLDKITRADVRFWHQDLMATPYEANRALAVLSRTFTWGLENDKCQFNPCKGVKSHSERKRKRFATEDELKKIKAILDREEQKKLKDRPYHIAFMWALILTGARPRSLERARWSEFVQTKEFGYLVTDGKKCADTGEADEIVFPAVLLDRINVLFRRNDFIFGGVKAPLYLWHKIQNEIGAKDLRLRDLRRTFATMGLSNGVGIDTIGELLNHKSAETTKIYAKLTNDAKVNAALQIAAAITKKVGT